MAKDSNKNPVPHRMPANKQVVTGVVVKPNDNPGDDEVTMHEAVAGDLLVIDPDEVTVKTSLNYKQTNTNPPSVQVQLSQKRKRRELAARDRVMKKIHGVRAFLIHHRFHGVFLVALMLLLAVFFVYLTRLRSMEEVLPESVRTPSKTISEKILKLTPIKIYSETGTVLDARTLKAGTPIRLMFLILSGGDEKSSVANFTADLRIYEQSGRMIAYTPEIATFKEVVDIKTDALQVAIDIDLKSSLPAGYYRIVIQLKDHATGKVNERQVQIKIVP